MIPGWLTALKTLVFLVLVVGMRHLRVLTWLAPLLSRLQLLSVVRNGQKRQNPGGNFSSVRFFHLACTFSSFTVMTDGFQR